MPPRNFVDIFVVVCVFLRLNCRACFEYFFFKSVFRVANSSIFGQFFFDGQFFLAEIDEFATLNFYFNTPPSPSLFRYETLLLPNERK